jgi:hypothetical protein
MWCWHHWTKWSELVNTYGGNKQQWCACTKCNKTKFRTLRWDKLSDLTAVLKALQGVKNDTTTTN